MRVYGLWLKLKNSYHSKAGKLEQQLFLACILEADECLGILSSTLHFDNLSYSETFVFDKLSGRELRHSRGTSTGIGRYKTT